MKIIIWIFGLWFPGNGLNERCLGMIVPEGILFEKRSLKLVKNFV